MNEQDDSLQHNGQQANGVTNLKSLRTNYRKSLDSDRTRQTRHGYITEISSASDTAAGASSMDEDFEPKVVHMERRRRGALNGVQSNGDHLGAASGFGKWLYIGVIMIMTRPAGVAEW